MSGQANNNFDALITSADDVSMIVVEVGYRLNAFGFMAIEELSAEQGGLVAIMASETRYLRFSGSVTISISLMATRTE